MKVRLKISRTVVQRLSTANPNPLLRNLSPNPTTYSVTAVFKSIPPTQTKNPKTPLTNPQRIDSIKLLSTLSGTAVVVSANIMLGIMSSKKQINTRTETFILFNEGNSILKF